MIDWFKSHSLSELTWIPFVRFQGIQSTTTDFKGTGTKWGVGRERNRVIRGYERIRSDKTGIFRAETQIHKDASDGRCNQCGSNRYVITNILPIWTFFHFPLVFPCSTGLRSEKFGFTFTFQIVSRRRVFSVCGSWTAESSRGTSRESAEYGQYVAMCRLWRQWKDCRLFTV